MYKLGTGSYPHPQTSTESAVQDSSLPYRTKADPMLEEHIEIVNKLGLHARAATKLANTANRYSSQVSIEFSGKSIDGKSIMSLMLLAAAKGSVVTVRTEGGDETEAMDAIRSLIQNRFDEEE